MKSFLLPLTLIAIVLIPAHGLRAQSRVRLVNVVADAPALELHIDSTATPIVKAVSNGSASEIADLPGSSAHLRVTTTGGSVALADTTIATAGNQLFTLFLVDHTTIEAIAVASPATMTVPADSTMLRFVNLSPTVGSLGVRASLTPDFSYSVENVGYGSATGYRMVPTSSLTMTLSDNGGRAIHRSLGYLAGGAAITVVIAGEYDSTNLARLRVYGLVDSDTNSQEPMQSFSLVALKLGGLRVVHALANAGPLAIFRDSMVSDSTPLDYRFASSRRNDLIDAHRFQVATQAGGLAGTLAGVDVTVVPDTVMTVVLAGRAGGTIRPIVLKSPIDNPTIDGARFRVVDAVGDGVPFDVSLRFADSSSETFNEMRLGSVSPTQLVPAGQVYVTITLPGNTPVTFGGAIPPNATVTAIISGGEGSDVAAKEPAYVSLLVEDNPGEQEPMILLSPTLSVPGDRRAPAASLSVVPNPSNGDVRLGYSLPASNDVTVLLYDALGREVAAVHQGREEGGLRSASLSTAGLPEGTYMALVRGGNGERIAIGRLVVVR